MTQQSTTNPVPSTNGESTVRELFALTDEQILEIEPEAQDVATNPAAPIPSRGSNPTVISSEAQRSEKSLFGDASDNEQRDSSSHVAPRNDSVLAGAAKSEDNLPQWLAEKMADPQTGAETRDFWNAIQQSRQEAAAYREIFAKPEDARAAAERSRALEEIDAAFYGRAGNSPEDLSAARAALAQRMMREDPAAFREMVFAGLRALEANSVAPRFSEASSEGKPSNAHVDAALNPNATPAATPRVGARHAVPSPTEEQPPHLAAYRSFEKSANEELDRSVGGAIDRALTQALPNANRVDQATTVGERHTVPLHDRLSTAIREDLEAALKGDRQLGEQVAQILSSRRFDDSTRAQVVRLINDRAQQLVPVAARRVINDWTQATLSAHRARLPDGQAKTQKAPSLPAQTAASGCADIAPSGSDSGPARLRSGQPAASGKSPRITSRSGRVDYNKLSDEQILDL